MKKLLSAVLIVLLTVTMALPAFAAENDGLKARACLGQGKLQLGGRNSLSLSAQNDSGLDIKQITKHIAPEGYEAPQDSELSGYLASGNRMSLKAVYGGKGLGSGRKHFNDNRHSCGGCCCRRDCRYYSKRQKRQKCSRNDGLHGVARLGGSFCRADKRRRQYSNAGAELQCKRRREKT